jgi:hypothetical protein
MVEYRMRIYLPGERLHETQPIFALDDAAAKAEARKFYADLVATLRNQANPKIDGLRVERFCLYRGDHLVCEEVAGY